MHEIGISIIVPALNEEGNIKTLVQRIDRALSARDIRYEIILIDDYSIDATYAVTQHLSRTYPIRPYRKRGGRGKAFSLLEGFGYARYGLLAIIDADLQYPPEAIPDMFAHILINDTADIVVANRRIHQEPLIRQWASKSFTFLFAYLLHGIQCDVQSGLKVFRRQIVDEITLDPTPWTFDLEFLIKARNAGYRITTVDITFHPRIAGISKLKLFRSIFEIGLNAVVLKLIGTRPFSIKPDNNPSMLGAGIGHRQQRFITHTTLNPASCAVESFHQWQKVALYVLFSVILIGLFHAPIGTGIALMAIISAAYFMDVLLSVFLVHRSLKHAPELTFTHAELDALDEKKLPLYTILCPLYREANILPHFLRAIASIKWPKRMLDVQLLLEEDDAETLASVSSIKLPHYIRTIIVPRSFPRTKPKACNYGLAFARGEYLVVYDAEDIPDPYQLRKAYLGFQRVDTDVACLQAKLNYYNPHQNVLTRLFTAEYSLWFDVILPGLQSCNAYIPLGGTSNHFKTVFLRKLQGWDPFNVTEDCDLGVRLFRSRYKTAVIDSVTLEEANSKLVNWLKQRSRWMKGYMQTYLVHVRNPLLFIREHGVHALFFHLYVGGKLTFALINPLLWATTIAYFAFRATLGPTIEALFPPIVFTMAGFSLVFGNFLFLYYYMIGLAKRKQWSLLKYVYLVPLYWFLTSIAAYIALYQLIKRPHYWEKTRHGLHLEKRGFVPQLQPVFGSFRSVAALTRKQVDTAFGRGVFASGSVLITAMVASNIVNLLFNAYLGRVLSYETLGLVIFINTLWLFSTLFFNALSTTINHTTAHLATTGAHDTSARFLSLATGKASLVALGISTLWIGMVPVTAKFFHIADLWSFILFTPIFFTGAILFANKGYLQGSLLFKPMATLMLTEAVSKLSIALILNNLGLTRFVYLSIPLSICIAAVVSLWMIQRMKLTTHSTEDVQFPGKFYIASLLTSITGIVFISVDLVFVKHFLTPLAAGEYSLLSLVGKMMYFFGSLPLIFMVTFVSRDMGIKRNPKKTLQLIGFSTFILTAIGVIALGPFGSFIIPAIFGAKAYAIVPYLNLYVTAIALFVLSQVIVTYHLAQKHYLFPLASVGLSVFVGIGITRYHASIAQIVQVITTVSAFGLATMMLLHAMQHRFRFITRNVLDILSVFATLPAFPARSSSHLRILIFNWRDTKHVYAGGAEVYMHEIARRWVSDGHQVTLFCGNDGASPRNETVDGVHVVRRGGFYMVYACAFIYYAMRFRGRYDLIIDCHNGIPFFTPLYARKPIYCLMHHVHQEVFRRSLSKPFARFAQFLEKDLMPLVYKNIPFITVSESSKRDMQHLNIGNAGISVIHPGVDLKRLAPATKSSVPAILYLGRLKAYKSIYVLIHAFQRILQKLPSARLVIAGSGEEEDRLKVLAAQLGVAPKVRFLGHVTERQKRNLLQKAWVLVNPSYMEGWAITTIEANACGTPVVASNVPGLRDSVVNPHTGFLVEYGNISAFASSITKILRNSSLRETLMHNAYNWAQNFSWDTTSAKFLRLISQRKESVRLMRFSLRRIIGLSIIIILFVTAAALARQNPHTSEPSILEKIKIEKITSTDAQPVHRNTDDILNKIRIERISPDDAIILYESSINRLMSNPVNGNSSYEDNEERNVQQ